MKERVRWIDIAKFFGIFAIYLGHFGAQAGRAYTFVFTHHVALFFFISGCMENYNKEENFVKFVWKKIKTIIVPFFVFAILSAMVATIEKGYEIAFVKAMVVEVLRGVVRNTYVAASLWFLTCLFVMQIIFFAIKKVKNRVLVFAISAGLYVIANYVIYPHPLAIPSMYFNMDSALYYIIYYAAGFVLYPYIYKLFELDTWVKKLLFIATGGFALLYTGGMFFGMDLLSFVPFPAQIQIFTAVFVTCIMIYAYFVVAKLLEDVHALASIGENTLYLCGSEFIVKIIVVDLLAIFGLSTNLITPVATYLYVGLLLLFANKYLVPIEKYIVKKIVG